MALISPGVSVEVINETFYDSSSPGSVPLIVVATAANKASPSGVGVAPFTTASTKGRLLPVSSQRELIQNYGNPLFYSAGGSQLHGYELNEYGLHAAYQFLGISNRAYILRADIDLAELLPSDSAPAGPPANGTFWLNTASTSFGVFQSNGHSVPGSAWVSKTVRVAYATDTVLVSGVSTPKATFGKDGDFAIVVHVSSNFLFEKLAGTWHKVGSAAWKAARPTRVRSVTSPTLTATTTIIINGTTVTLTGTTATAAAADIIAASIANVTARVESNALVIENTAGGDLVLSGTALAALGITAKTYKGVSLVFTNDASYPAGSVVGDLWVKGTSTNKGADWALSSYDAVSRLWTKRAAPFFPFNSALANSDPAKDAAARAGLEEVVGTTYVGYDAATGHMELRRFNGTEFETLVYEASASEPVGPSVDGALWFSTDFRADIMVSDGVNWRGYKNVYPNTDPKGAIISGSAPTKQSDGTPLVDNDLWIDASDLENYPRMYRYDGVNSRWRLMDTSDQTSPFGVLFADARADSGVAFTGQVVTGYAYGSTEAADLLVSDFVDPDAPEPRSVPAGMLLFNTRYGTYNVKRFLGDYFGYGGFDANTNYALTTYTVGGSSYVFPALANNGRWVTVSGNRPNGTPLMGRRAQRAMVTKAMSAALTASEDARAEVIDFNLMAAPGYPELIDEMISLNVDQKNTAFIVGDTPARLEANSQRIVEWATNAYGAAQTGEDGLYNDGSGQANSEFVGLYYPWGLSTNVDGSEVMVPASTMALRTIAYSDQVSYPWFAPAGFQRGLVSNASAVGYLTKENEFKAVVLNEGLRDVLYSNRINPIAYIQNRGLVVFGQKTLAPAASAMDRVNVARLVNHLNAALDELAKPFLFQQNDNQTREAFTAQLERLLNSLTGLRAIEDYLVHCNEENNTPERVARNELWADIAIQPTKSVEFIYIPVRLNIGGDL